MSFQINMAGFKISAEILNQQAAATKENWNDPVQRRFYNEFIDTLPAELMNYLNALNRLDSGFENAERLIEGLE